MIGTVGAVPSWIGWIGAVLSLWLMIGSFQKAPTDNTTFFNYLRPKRFLWGFFLAAASADIILFPHSS